MHRDLPPPTLVQDPAGFQRLVRHLEHVEEVAVDTEADSFFSYREKVCLIQITAGDEDFLVDPLAGFDLSALGRMLADPGKLKVFHDGEYDILILKRDFGFEFKRLFDTRVAAATLGTQAPGLASVLNEHFQIELDKSMQRSDWSERPLSEKQIRYARLDTHYLLPLMREQITNLEERGRMMIVEGECRRLEAIEPPDSSFDPDEFVRIKGSRLLPPLERQVLRELYILRERLAEASNQPPFRIMNPDTLVEMAQFKPRHRADLVKVRGFSSKQVRRMGDEVLAAIETALEKGPLRKFPVLPTRDGTHDLSDAQLELHERLKHWRKNVAIEWGIDSAYLLNRHILLRIAKSGPTTMEDVGRIEGMQDWHREHFSASIAEVVREFEGEARSGSWQPRRRRPARRGGDGSSPD